MLEADEVSRQVFVLLHKIKDGVFSLGPGAPGECFKGQHATDDGLRTNGENHE